MRQFKIVFCLLCFFSFLQTNKSFSQIPNVKKYTVSGYIREAGSSEQLIGVSISVPDLKIGGITNTFGFYSLTFSQIDSVEIIFSAMGYSSEVRKIKLNHDLDLNINLVSVSNTLNEIVIEADRKITDSPQMSVINIPISQIKDIPSLLGEKDVLKVLQLMPGVQKGGEGNSGLYVRGGGPDQNLIILDDAVIYNPYHLFGFYSLFNGDALKSVELTKGGFPARYGGRLSSVVEMNMKDGNKESLRGEAGIGLISSKLLLEGPIIKNKSSFLISARRTYLDALVKPFLPKDRSALYNFYDLNAKLNYDFGQKDKVYLSGYLGQDNFRLNYIDEGDKNYDRMHWGNIFSTLRWNHLFSNKLFSNTSVIYSNYNLTNSQEGNEYKQIYKSYIRDFTLKYDLHYHLNPKHSIRAGMQTTFHRFRPAAFVEIDSLKQNNYKTGNTDAVESGIYLEDTYKPIPKVLINAGIRFSHYLQSGKNYFRPEPRISAAYKLKENLSLKISFASMNQYVHMLSTSTYGLPTDLWVPSTKRVLPQSSTQAAVGIAKDFKNNIAFSVEAYYKKSNKMIGYKDGSNFINLDYAGQVSNWEDQITVGQGWSYGTEFLLQKKTGKISGWIGYTLSKTQLQFDELNSGKKFYARYDRRHDISVVAIYKPNSRITLSSTWVYGTGNAITLPVGTLNVPSFTYPGTPFQNYYRPIFGEKNTYRMPAYHRLDLGVQFHKMLRKNRERTWEISIYNAYNRKNPYFYFVVNRKIKAIDEYGQSITVYTHTLKQISLFPILPSVSYKIKF